MLSSKQWHQRMSSPTSNNDYYQKEKMFNFLVWVLKLVAKPWYQIGSVYNKIFGNLIPRDTSIKLGIMMAYIRLVWYLIPILISLSNLIYKPTL